MDSVFKFILATSLYGSIVGIIILIFKFILNKGLNASWHYMVWIVLILKLIIPFGPESTISLFNVIPSVKELSIPQSGYKPVQNYETNAANASNKISENNENTSSGNADIHESSDNESYQSKTSNLVISQKQSNEEESSPKSIINIISYGWALGMALILIWFVLAYYSLNSKLKQCCIIEDKKMIDVFEICKSKMKISKNIRLILQNTIYTPSIYGIARPRILLSASAMKLGSRELEFVFLHELAHYKRKDLYVNHLLLALQTVHWFNPIIWYLFKKIRQDMEAAADEKVLSILESSQHKEYGRVLLTVLESLNLPKLAPRLIGMVDNKKNMEKRIKLIKMANLFKSRRRFVLAVGLICIVLLGLITLSSSISKDKSKPVVIRNDAKTLYDYKTPYIGDNSKVVGIIDNLPYAKYRKEVSLKTDAEPYELTVDYDFPVGKMDIDKVDRNLKRNATVLFALIGDVEKINFNTEGIGILKYVYYKEDLQWPFEKPLSEYSKNIKKFNQFLNRLDSTSSKVTVGTTGYNLLTDEHFAPSNGVPLDKASDIIINDFKRSVEFMISSATFNLSVEEITTQTVWENMKIQLYLLKNYDSNLKIAILKDEKQIELIPAKSVFGVYVSDLNNDGTFEICTNQYTGSGIIDANVSIFDIVTNMQYRLSKRGIEDLYLRLDKDMLFVDIVPYGKSKDSIKSTGRLSLKKDGVSIVE